MVIWDRLVRSWHWCLVAVVVANYWFLEGGDDLHNYAGYALFALMILRLSWGVWGRNPHALLVNFVPTPAAIREHFNDLRSGVKEHPAGHNPLGALFICFVFLSIAYLSITGWLHEEVDTLFGNDFLQNTHRWVSDALMIGAGIHIAGVLVMQKLTGTPLIKTMITGKR